MDIKKLIDQESVTHCGLLDADGAPGEVVSEMNDEEIIDNFVIHTGLDLDSKEDKKEDKKESETPKEDKKEDKKEPVARSTSKKTTPKK